MFLIVPGQENGGYVFDRIIAKTVDGCYRATVATQTADVTLVQQQHPQEGHGLAAGMPLSADVSSSMYHGAWPIHKGLC